VVLSISRYDTEGAPVVESAPVTSYFQASAEEKQLFIAPFRKLVVA
jgi:hypothetical protein